jgi:hypothetical protein
MKTPSCALKMLLIRCSMSKTLIYLPSQDEADFPRLAHIVFGPHDAKFHGLWNELRSEHQDLLQRGYTGEGFLSEGKRLGGRKLPLDEARRRARKAAETRQVLAAKSGQRLGGAASTPSQRSKDLRHLMAEAAQKRATITNGCGSAPGKENKKTEELVQQATRNGFRTQAEEDNANDEAILQAYIELLADEEREQQNKQSPGAEGSSSKGASTSRSPSIRSADSAEVIDLADSARDSDDSGMEIGGPPISPKESSAAKGSKTRSSPDALWTCPVCTLENPENFLCCEACTTERPSEPMKDRNLHRERKHRTDRLRYEPQAPSQSDSTFWICHRCGNSMESQWWTCAACGTMKLTS